MTIKLQDYDVAEHLRTPAIKHGIKSRQSAWLAIQRQASSITATPNQRKGA